MYFLKTLEDESLDLTEAIIVIDDPISSLDANSLYSAFSFMKTKTALQNIFAKQVNSEFYRIPLYNPYFIVLSSPDLRKVISGYLIII